jgi:hypothetical protein
MMAKFNNEEFEIVQGSQLFDIFQHLFNEKTLVKVSVGGHDIEQLLLVEEIEESEDHFLFKIERSDDLPQEMTSSEATIFSFEFNGPDQLPYQCVAQLSSITENHLWLKCPDHLKRYQLRQNFRIHAPRGAKLKTVIKKAPVVMNIINISLGGILCYVNTDLRETVRNTEIIRSIDLVFTLRNERTVVHITSAERRRIEEHLRPGKIGVAYEFIKIERDQKKKLIAQIYELQREHLKSRLKHI